MLLGGADRVADHVRRRPATVNGAAGLVVFTGDRPYAVLAFTVRNERIVEIDILADPERLARLDFSVLDA